VSTRNGADTSHKKRTSCPPGIQSQFFHHLAHSSVTVPTMLVCRVKILFILLKIH
jgi:hypothetical protein